MIKIYNTLTKQIENVPFKDIFRIYTCGPTVYDRAHIGNFRSYLTIDLFKRVLLAHNIQVKHVINITDVGHLTLDDMGEDRMLIGLKRDQRFQTPYELARYYEDLFIQDYKKLNFLMPDYMPRATDYVLKMAQHVQKLIKKGYAYQTESGNVYFRVHKFQQYGALSGNTLSQLIAGSSQRIKKENEEEKEEPLDFALWKVDPSHLMQWDTELGRGFPGWHIECTTMALDLLGEHLDMHTGGEDNIFPHHECEIAQTESLIEHKWVQFWLHTRHLFVEGQKMSKTEKNFLTLDDLIQKGHHPFAIRLTLMGAHFQKKLDFRWADLEKNRLLINQMIQVRALLQFDAETGEQLRDPFSEQIYQNILAKLSDNLNVSETFSLLHDYLDIIGGKKREVHLAHFRLEILDKILWLIGLDLKQISYRMPESEVKRMITQREKLKKDKRFQEADQIRDQLKEASILCLDLPEGTITYPVLPPTS